MFFLHISHWSTGSKKWSKPQKYWLAHHSRRKSKVCRRTNLLKSVLRLFRTWDEFWHLLICVCLLHTIHCIQKHHLRKDKKTECQWADTGIEFLLPSTTVSLSEQCQAPVAICFSRAGCSWFPKTLAHAKAVLFYLFQDFIFKEWELVRTTYAKSIPTTR